MCNIKVIEKLKDMWGFLIALNITCVIFKTYEIREGQKNK